MMERQKSIDEAMADLRAAVRALGREILRTQPFKWIASRMGVALPEETP